VQLGDRVEEQAQREAAAQRGAGLEERAAADVFDLDHGFTPWPLL
jgi:hypothetical protein